jgi:large subunit ribosomal protein L2
MKKLTINLKRNQGRNNRGLITSRGRGGGNISRYRIIDFTRSGVFNIEGKVVKFEKDPKRAAYVALVIYKNGIISYILAPENLKPGELIICGENPPLNRGNRLLLKRIPLGIFVHLVSKNKKAKGIIGRAAGTGCKILRQSEKFTEIEMPSGKRMFVDNCNFATIGFVSNTSHFLKKKEKAGETRWKGRKPIVRGVAKNPIDHPHGGGEGKSSGGRCSVSPWGWLTKGFKTKKRKKRLHEANLIKKFK